MATRRYTKLEVNYDKAGDVVSIIVRVGLVGTADFEDGVIEETVKLEMLVLAGDMISPDTRAKLQALKLPLVMDVDTERTRLVAEKAAIEAAS